jgi:hypothetical protein
MDDNSSVSAGCLTQRQLISKVCGEMQTFGKMSVTRGLVRIGALHDARSVLIAVLET